MAKIKGANNSAIKRHYEYLDKYAPDFLTYYRLKQIDKDGSYRYSDILFIDAIDTKEIEVYITPNPVQELLTLKISSAEMVSLSQLEIYNSSGQKVYEHPKSTFFEAFKEKELSVSQKFNPGIYTCLAVLGEKVIRLKFVVIN